MTRSQQRQITLDLCNNLKKVMREKIKHIPENWDGLEIRQLLNDTLAESFCQIKMQRKRKSEYENTRAITSQL